MQSLRGMREAPRAEREEKIEAARCRLSERGDGREAVRQGGMACLR